MSTEYPEVFSAVIIKPDFVSISRLQTQKTLTPFFWFGKIKCPFYIQLSPVCDMAESLVILPG